MAAHPMLPVRSTRLDRLLLPVHRWVWRNPARRARKLLRFAETEAEGGRDLSHAAALTSDPLLRRLYLRHALDEQRHSELFRRRGRELRAALPANRAHVRGFDADWFAPGERGLDELRVEGIREDALLAFLHLSERAAAGRFAVYRRVLAADPETRAVFSEVLRDEAFHMSYTYGQLARKSGDRPRWPLWRARLLRLWKGYLRIATALASLMAAILLTVQYFVLLPGFALLARRAARREPLGWQRPMARDPKTAPTSQY